MRMSPAASLRAQWRSNPEALHGPTRAIPPARAPIPGTRSATPPPRKPPPPDDLATAGFVADAVGASATLAWGALAGPIGADAAAPGGSAQAAEPTTHAAQPAIAANHERRIDECELLIPSEPSIPHAKSGCVPRSPRSGSEDNVFAVASPPHLRMERCLCAPRARSAHSGRRATRVRARRRNRRRRRQGRRAPRDALCEEIKRSKRWVVGEAIGGCDEAGLRCGRVGE